MAAEEKLFSSPPSSQYIEHSITLDFSFLYFLHIHVHKGLLVSMSPQHKTKCKEAFLILCLDILLLTTNKVWPPSLSLLCETILMAPTFTLSQRLNGSLCSSPHPGLHHVLPVLMWF